MGAPKGVCSGPKTTQRGRRPAARSFGVKETVDATSILMTSVEAIKLKTTTAGFLPNASKRLRAVEGQRRQLQGHKHPCEGLLGWSTGQDQQRSQGQEEH